MPRLRGYRREHSGAAPLGVPVGPAADALARPPTKCRRLVAEMWARPSLGEGPGSHGVRVAPDLERVPGVATESPLRLAVGRARRHRPWASDLGTARVPDRGAGKGPPLALGRGGTGLSLFRACKG